MNSFFLMTPMDAHTKNSYTPIGVVFCRTPQLHEIQKYIYTYFWKVQTIILWWTDKMSIRLIES